MTVFNRFAVITGTIGLAWCASGIGADWIIAPSYYTHDQSGQRVQQYTPIGPFYIFPSPNFQKSGYRHTRSSLQVGNSVDHYHVVEEWGKPVRPYEEWRFPYRPYSVPYPEWGPQYFPWGYGFGGGPYGFSGPGFPGTGYPGTGYPGAGYPGAGFHGDGDFGRPFNGSGYSGRAPVPYPGYRPWFDDRYPAFDDRAPFRYQPFPQPFERDRRRPGPPPGNPDP